MYQYVPVARKRPSQAPSRPAGLLRRMVRPGGIGAGGRLYYDLTSRTRVRSFPLRNPKQEGPQPFAPTSLLHFRPVLAALPPPSRRVAVQFTLVTAGKSRASPPLLCADLRFTVARSTIRACVCKPAQQHRRHCPPTLLLQHRSTLARRVALSYLGPRLDLLFLARLAIAEWDRS